MTEELDLSIRAFRPEVPDEVGFVTSLWLGSYERHELADDAPRAYFGRLRHAYYTRHSPIVNEFIRRATVRIATLVDDDDAFVGFACGERDGASCVVHYVGVKSAFRRNLAGKRLLEELLGRLGGTPRLASHVTRNGARLVKRFGLAHVPFAAFVRGGNDEEAHFRSTATVGADPGHTQR